MWWQSLYFKLLDSSFLQLALFILTLYTSCILLAAMLIVATNVADAITVPGDAFEALDGTLVEGTLDDSLLGLSRFGRSIFFSATALITMGWGIMGVMCYALATAFQFFGTILNVFIFSVVVTKFQQPVADTLFGRFALLTTRNGEPHLLLRVGNRRGNLVYNPEFRVGVMYQEATEEGEILMRLISLEVPQPVALKGVYTIAIPLDRTPGNPLLELTPDKLHKLGSAAPTISVAFSGRDSVYHDDLCALKRYMPEDYRFDCVFQDVLQKVNGIVKINFDMFDEILSLNFEDEDDVDDDASDVSDEPIPAPMFDPGETDHNDDSGQQQCVERQSAIIGQIYAQLGYGEPGALAVSVETEGTPSQAAGAEPCCDPGQMVLIHGAFHWRGILWPACTFSAGVQFCFLEAGIHDVRVCFTDLVDKDPWFLQRFGEKAASPALIINEGSGPEYIMGTEAVMSKIGQRYPQLEVLTLSLNLPKELAEKPLCGIMDSFAIFALLKDRARGDEEIEEKGIRLQDDELVGME
eukprot:gene7955-9450_t